MEERDSGIGHARQGGRLRPAQALPAFDEITVNGIAAPENHYAQLKNEGGSIRIQAERECILLVLSGEPLNEPYVNYGPFVMNTEEEIHQAIEDYKAGKFGFLED